MTVIKWIGQLGYDVPCIVKKGNETKRINGYKDYLAFEKDNLAYEEIAYVDVTDEGTIRINCYADNGGK